MPTDIQMDGEGNLVEVSSDERSPAWERARHWLLATGLTALCDDFTDRTERRRDAITRLWRNVERWPGNQLDADHFNDLEIEGYVGYLQSLSRQLRQDYPVTTTTQTPHEAAAGGGDEEQTETTKKRSTVKGEAQEKLVAALTKHHKYQDGSCLNIEAIGSNELAPTGGCEPRTPPIGFFGRSSRDTRCTNGSATILRDSRRASNH